MTVIALPPTFRPESFSLLLSSNQRSFASPFGGSEQGVDMMNDRWLATVALPKGPQDVVASREAFVNAMRGMTNTVLLHHFGRPVPRGTMRGSPTLVAGGAPQGAASVTIQTVAGETLLAGDMVGIGGLLLQAAQDGTADGAGVLVLPIVNRLRRALAGGAAVVWDRPKAPFRLTSSPAFVFLAGYAEGVSLDFAEAIA